MASYSKFLVVCPGDAITGGPELLHQLVHELRKQGRDANICYWPANREYQCPTPYRKYDAPQCRFEDKAGNLVILPEVLTRISRRIKESACAIWWLSVDNYFRFPQNHRYLNPFTTIAGNRFYDPWRRFNSLRRRERRRLGAMKSLIHYAQSHYARDFLAKAGIESAMLTDYLSEEHLRPREQVAPKQDIVVYNPKKGFEVTQALIRRLPHLRFVPIQNMTAAEVSNLLRSAKVYIDFGHHPGKDRPPREAALAGCCVITGTSGSAACEVDMPIPPAYRMDPYGADFASRFARTVEDIFLHHDVRSRDFEPWREVIRSERKMFERQVAQLFG